jgi:hypothetical protein
MNITQKFNLPNYKDDEGHIIDAFITDWSKDFITINNQLNPIDPLRMDINLSMFSHVGSHTLNIKLCDRKPDCTPY